MIETIAFLSFASMLDDTACYCNLVVTVRTEALETYSKHALTCTL